MATARMVGCSAAHMQLLETLGKVAPTDAEVLITGPTGVGKELYANYVHEKSLRSQARFVPINCGAFPTDLFENELFGHVAGAFTGAGLRTDGLVTQAEHGTLFLDEVDSLSLFSQVKLLRFLQEREYRRLGDAQIKHADVRVVAATNTNLEAAVHAGNFRKDLFFRLRVVPIHVPPLRERRDDLSLLTKMYTACCSDAYRLPQVVFSDAAMRKLESYAWPGNIRELENCIKFLTCLQLQRPVLPHDLPLLAERPPDELISSPAIDDARPFHQAKKDVVNDFERRYLQGALRRSKGNISRAALASGKPRRVFFELMRKHGMSSEDFGARPATTG